MKKTIEGMSNEAKAEMLSMFFVGVEPDGDIELSDRALLFCKGVYDSSYNRAIKTHSKQMSQMVSISDLLKTVYP